MDALLAPLIIAVISPLAYPLMPGERIFIGYLFTAFLPIAYLAWKQNNWRWDFDALWESCFPKTIWKHPSHIIDLKFFFINTALFTTLVAVYIGGGEFAASHTALLLETLLGKQTHIVPLTLLAGIGVTLLLALLGDFAIFLAHYLQHKVPFLWEFHKVHHSAQVMTPITVYRMHPVDDALAMFLGGILMGTGMGFIRYIFMQDPPLFMIAGLNICTFVFYILFYNLRHSHIWLHYPGILGRIFISPAQHQIHHSSAQKHWDKNFGFIFGIWDWMFGCLYVPREKEELVLGIGPETAEYNSVTALYLLPFIKNWRRIKRKLLFKQPITIKDVYEKAEPVSSSTPVIADS